MTQLKSMNIWPVIGNEAAVSFLQRSIAAGKTSHAYLFSGPNQIGKRFTADLFGKTILCQEDDSSPCDKCIMCQQFEKGIHSDLIILSKEEGKKNISVEAVRDFQHKLNTSSLLADTKIAIIDDAAKLSEKGVNALLKILEEPPKKSIIILITEFEDKLPATIISRCQVFSFRPVERTKIAAYLESIGSPRSDALKIAAISQGRPGRAIDYFKKPFLLKKQEEVANEFINVFSEKLYRKFALIQKYLRIRGYQNKIDLSSNIIDIWLAVIRDLILIQTDKAERITYLDYSVRLSKLANNYSRREIITNLNYLTEIQKLLNTNSNPQLALENYFLTLKNYA